MLCQGLLYAIHKIMLRIVMKGLRHQAEFKTWRICMTLQDILAGESKYIEFKESLLDKSIGTYETRLFEN